MPVRLGIIATCLIGAITLWFAHYCVAAKWVFLASVVLMVEAVMFNYLTYSSLNIRIAKSKDAKLLKISPDTFAHNILCVPIYLRVRFWEARELRILLRSNNIHVDSELFDGCARFQNGGLDWFTHKSFACVGYLEGNCLVLGTPVIHEYLQGILSCPVKLEIWKDDRLVAFACYTLSLNNDGAILLSDSECKVGSHV